jgi:two-component system response regulator FixJ
LNSSSWKATIALLDDDVEVLKSLQFLLETHGFAVRLFSHALPFLEWAKRGPFDCVVLDYKMPCMDGLQTMDALTALGIASPIFLMTGHPDDAVIEKALSRGARDVFLKPNFQDHLLASLRGIIPGSDIRKIT